MTKEKKNKFITSSHVLSFLVDIYEQERTKDSLNEAIALVTQLEDIVDTLHCKYWAYRKQKLNSVLKEL